MDGSIYRTGIIVTFAMPFNPMHVLVSSVGMMTHEIRLSFGLSFYAAERPVVRDLLVISHLHPPCHTCCRCVHLPHACTTLITPLLPHTEATAKQEEAGDQDMNVDEGVLG